MIRSICATLLGFVTGVTVAAGLLLSPVGDKLQPVAASPYQAPIQCLSPCVVRRSLGGVIRDHVRQGRELRESHTWLIIDGPCASACTLMVDEARPYVCITRNARFGFHQGYMPDVVTGDPLVYFDLDYSADLELWIEENGGLPRDDLLIMNFEEATRFFQPCDGVI